MESFSTVETETIISAAGALLGGDNIASAWSSGGIRGRFTGRNLLGSGDPKERRLVRVT